MICSLAQISEEKLGEIRSLEEKIGKPLLAFSCQNVSVSPVSEKDLTEIKDLEKKLDVVLVAV